MRPHGTADQLAEIVAGIQDNVPGSEKQLFLALSKGIRFLLMRQLLNREDAEDGVQDCFIAVLSAIRKGSLRERGAVAGFSVTVARRYAARIIEGRTISRARSVDIVDDAVPIDARQESDRYDSEKAALLRAALLRLSATDREILERFYLYQESEEQIRESMDLTANQFRLKKSRAKAKLAEEAQRLTRSSVASVKSEAETGFAATA